MVQQTLGAKPATQGDPQPAVDMKSNSAYMYCWCEQYTIIVYPQAISANIAAM